MIEVYRRFKPTGGIIACDVEERISSMASQPWVEERRLFPGDYNYGAPGAVDERVWNETGCTCILVTSTKDILSWGTL